MKTITRYFVAILFLFLCKASPGQEQKISMHDSLDGAFDLSSYVIDANGFIPIPMIITEPALGSFGGVIAPIFLKRRLPLKDSVNGTLRYTTVAPDITGGALGYTANKSWFGAAFRAGTFIKSRIKYRVGGIYADINMSFFRNLSNGEEKEFALTLKAYGLMLQAIKRIGHSSWYAGSKFSFSQVRVETEADSLPSFVREKEKSSMISSLGAIVELDNRDNVFTPDKGMKLHLDAVMSDNVIGSDFDFWRLNYFMFWYHPVVKKITGGLRIDGQQALGDAPFYMLPYLNLRGIPVYRYQGNAALVGELEFRWDLYKRWSLMGYTGAGKAFNDWKDFGSTNTEVSYGTGFRYLLARKFKLRAGIDIAKGPENWAYYIVFGNNWVR
jgi:outer membrane protein assembly factor BamA